MCCATRTRRAKSIWGYTPRVLSDLLGHRDLESIFVYVRIATETLRDVSLPVPT